MVAYPPRQPLLRRQDGPIAAPSVAGLSGVKTVDNPVETSGGLVVDTAAGTGTQSAPPFIPTGGTPKSTSAFTVTPDSPTTSSSPSSVGASSTKQIALSTVVASCVGAFVGATAIVIFSLWMYRRYSRSLKQRAYKSRGPFNHRNGQSNGQRQRSHGEAWNRLEDHESEDKWEGSYQTKEGKDSTGARELTQVAPMEKLTMFKKTPSVRTAYTHKSTDGTDFSFPSSYAEFDPKLADALKSGQHDMPEPKPFLERVDSDPSSYLTVHSRLSGAMSPTQNMAIPTPPPMFSNSHKWESAEVVAFPEAQSVEVLNHNPFEDEDDDEQGRRKSHHNPFFGARDHEISRGRSNSTSSARSRSRSRSRSRNRANSTATTVSLPKISAKAKGKERMRYSAATDHSTPQDPFEDANGDELPRPSFMTHAPTSSTSSMDNSDRERALQSLIAALETPEDEVRDRLRIASMQPSIVSRASSIGVSDVANEFPLPPSHR
ncbi:hypothetical protein CPB83DRAFT_521705 [Crepidotus variabilis]|uniref:Uncharacterized protein n=1 Tax=Crepidotus variabilis TaxID=179855 RepID=A0A9P6EAB4_9AGAR|nr:hypothetical protein CPB83DRAFT_521705 [Crepidotus variabilis]